MNIVETLFEQIKQKQAVDSNLVKEVRGSEMLHEDLRALLKQQKDEDDLVLFNWFIGSKFSICINDLRK